eukprot:TRINITY_DN10814_c0_g1_i1.p1 TRINITY_DN10814_c0_g1~~TRINITY_DN10814_c0_g1_i1.p1  ORF type:complete len:288 (-),score=38.92 TRINITY_DN10814_c0_g1_i1:231-1055(-)
MPSAVTVNVYDVSTTNKPLWSRNGFLYKIGTGAFHAGVQVFGRELSYGYNGSGSGVFSCEPKKCTDHIFRESVAMGETELNEDDVDDLVKRLTKEWRGAGYDLLHHNCCTFSNVICEHLGVGPLPPWVTNLAAAGATIEDGVLKVTSGTKAEAIIAAAKAGQIDEQYLQKLVPAEAQHFLSAAQITLGAVDVKALIANSAQSSSEKDVDGAVKAASAEDVRVASDVEQKVIEGGRVLDRKWHVRERLKRIMCSCGATSASSPLSDQGLDSVQSD